MSKTGILTFHAAYNFGSNLQAYALLQTLKKMEYDCEIINYRPKTQKAMYGLINTKVINIGTIAKDINNIIHVKDVLNRNKKFEKFLNNYLGINVKKYLNDKQVKEEVNKYDNVICGSDQIWNLSKKTYDKSKVYYLDFPTHVNKVSYAPSFGNDTSYLSSNIENISNMIKKFDHVSLREIDAIKILRKYGIEATLTLDPTLLLSKEDWEELIGEPIIKKPYILYYSLNYNNYSVQCTKKIEENLNLEVISPFLHPKGINSKFKIKGDSGPLEFLNLIKYAECICTNSFHGTVFSILLEKPFYAIFDEEKETIIRENRKASLLEQLGLEKNMVSISNMQDFEKIKFTDYKQVKSKLNKLKETSISFLKESLV